MLLVSEPEWMKKASSSEGATELLTQTPSVTPAAFPTDSLTEGPTQTPSVTPAAFPTPSSSEGPTQMPTQTTSVTPAAFPTTSLPECPTQTTSVTPAAFQLTSLSEGQTQITSDTTAASHTTCLPESQTQLPPQIPSVTPAAFPTTSLPECPTQTTSVTPAAFQLTVLSEGQTQITSDTTAASHTTSLPESQTQLPPQIHSVTTAAFPTACLSKGQTQTPSLTPAAFSTATAQPMTHPEFTVFPFSGTSIAATPTMLRDALDIINDDMPRTPTNSNTRQLIDGDQPFADMFPSPSAADRRLSLAWDRKLDALNKRMSLMSRQLGEVTRMLTYIIHQQGSNRVIAEPAEPPFFTTPAVETPGISTHDNRLAAEPPLPHVQPDSRSCIDEFSDIPVHCRIPTEKLLQMKTAATSIGNFACFLTVRLFPELFTAENARFRYNFNGHRANKEPLDHVRKQYLQRYLLFFYPHLSDPKIYHENVVDPVNEYLRRKNLKVKTCLIF